MKWNSAAMLLLLLASAAGCGSEEATSALPTLEAHEFRKVLGRLRAEEFETFKGETRRLVELTFDAIPSQMAKVAQTIEGLGEIVKSVPTNPPPLALADVPGPIPLRISERLNALAAAAYPQFGPTEQAALRAQLAEFVIRNGRKALSNHVEQIATAVAKLEQYAAPETWIPPGKRPKDLYGWLYRMQRRALSKANPWDRRMGDYLARGAENWEDKDVPSTICLAHMMREVLSVPDMLSTVILIMKYDRKADFPAAYKAMLEETYEAAVDLAVERVQRSWDGIIYALDEYLYWEYEREAEADTTHGPVAETRPQHRGLLVEDDEEQAATQKGRDYALVVGIEDYEHWRDLQNPVRDAGTLATVLEASYGFEVRKLENPTKEQLLAAISSYYDHKFAPGDQLLFFFAGHGHYDARPRDRGYLALRDSREPRDDRLRESYLPHYMLIEELTKVPCDHVLIVLDACFGGAAFMGRERGGDDVMADTTIKELIRRKMPLRTRKLITSGAKEYVPDGPVGGHSPFAYRMLETLRTALDGRGYVTVSKLFAGVEEGRPGAVGGSLPGNDPGSDFFFIKK